MVKKHVYLLGDVMNPMRMEKKLNPGISANKASLANLFVLVPWRGAGWLFF
jgi:hypothetical protein